MALRLVLVSVVAGMGLVLPNAGDISGWAHSTQRWLNGRMAELDARASIDDTAFVYDAVAVEAAREAQSKISTSRPALALAKVVEEIENEQARKASAEPEPAPAPAPASAPIAAPLVVAAPAATVEVADDRAFDAVVDTMVADFAADSDLLAAREAEAFGPPFEAPQVEPTPVVIAAEPAPIPEDDRAFDALVNEMAAAFSADAETLAVREREAVAPKFALIEIGDDLYPGVAYALNRQAEGLEIMAAAPAPVAVAPGPAPATGNPEDRLAHAVHLTRQAVFAWVSLLHGPAVVTIAR